VGDRPFVLVEYLALERRARKVVDVRAEPKGLLPHWAEGLPNSLRRGLEGRHLMRQVIREVIREVIKEVINDMASRGGT
jgi:hypothetical protein